MPRQFSRLTIAPGITREGDHFVAAVAVGSARDKTRVIKRKSFPLATDPAVMQAWQFNTRADLLLARPAALVKGSLAADIPIFVASLPEGRYRVDSDDLLHHWAVSPLGTVPRQQITRVAIVEQIARWTDAGAAASTCNRRLGRLRKLYEAFDTVDAPNPTDKIKFLPEPKGEPRDIPAHVVDVILNAIPDLGRPERFKERSKISLTKIRLTVLAKTGIPPASLARVQPRDIDWAGARIYVRARRKGQGTPAAWVALLPDAVAALRAFVDAGLCGQSWSQSSVGKSWRVGIAHAKATAAKIAADTGDRTLADELDALPPRCKPYDLRHAFGSEIYRQTGDVFAVSHLMRHTNLETTKRYTSGAVPERVTAAIAAAAPHYAAAKATAAKVAARAARPLRLVRRPSAATR